MKCGIFIAHQLSALLHREICTGLAVVDCSNSVKAIALCNAPKVRRRLTSLRCDQVKAGITPSDASLGVGYSSEGLCNGRHFLRSPEAYPSAPRFGSSEASDDRSSHGFLWKSLSSSLRSPTRLPAPPATRCVCCSTRLDRNSCVASRPSHPQPVLASKYDATFSS